jgi:adenine deaminase
MPEPSLPVGGPLPDLEETIAVARGKKPADLLIRNAWVVDVFGAELITADVAVHAGRVIGFGEYEARDVVDIEGRFLSPGFIDAHLHIESTMLTPPEFARTVSPHGTTSVVCDPHEIANVLGVEGIRYMLAASEGLPVSIYVMLPPCVPATKMETSGAELNAGDLALLLQEERVLGLAEMMNYPAVLDADPGMLSKLRVASGHPVDGHAPGLSGKELSAYIAAGMGSDHECVTAAEAREKLGLGMRIMIREGTTEKNLSELIRLVTPASSRRFMFCSDDRRPGDLLEEGHIDHNLRLAIAAGVDPVQAIQMATINAAEYFGLEGIGAVAPGYRADFAVLDDLEKVAVSHVFLAGHTVSRDGRTLPFETSEPPQRVRDTVRLSEPGPAALAVEVKGSRIRVIGIVPDQVITETLITDPKVVDGLAVANTDRDILKIAVFERHHASGNVGVGFVKGMGLKRGAIATSVAHDSHNIIVAGASDSDMLLALKEIERMQGGAAVAAGGSIVASLPLPVAGLMSDQPAEVVAASDSMMLAAAREIGCSLRDPLITLSFMALPVIPSLKLTDNGLVDVERFEIVPLWLS